MSMDPKKNGGPVSKFWDSPDIIQSLESVKGWLSRNAKKVEKETILFFEIIDFRGPKMSNCIC